jgi:hypothetical protein
LTTFPQPSILRFQTRGKRQPVSAYFAVPVGL